MKFVPDLLEKKESQNIKRKVPTFKHLRRQLYNDNCPEVQMKYVFRDLLDGSIKVVNTTTAPKECNLRSRYEKLYEEAHVKVCMYVLGFKDMNRVRQSSEIFPLFLTYILLLNYLVQLLSMHLETDIKVLHRLALALLAAVPNR